MEIVQRFSNKTELNKALQSGALPLHSYAVVGDDSESRLVYLCFASETPPPITTVTSASLIGTSITTPTKYYISDLGYIDTLPVCDYVADSMEDIYNMVGGSVGNDFYKFYCLETAQPYSAQPNTILFNSIEEYQSWFGTSATNIRVTISNLTSFTYFWDGGTSAYMCPRESYSSIANLKAMYNNYTMNNRSVVVYYKPPKAASSVELTLDAGRYIFYTEADLASSGMGTGVPYWIIETGAIGVVEESTPSDPSTGDSSTGEITPDGTDRQFASKEDYYANLFGQPDIARVYVSTAEGGAVFTYNGSSGTPIEQYDESDTNLISLKRMYSNYSYVDREVNVYYYSVTWGAYVCVEVTGGSYVIYYASDTYTLQQGSWYWCIEPPICEQYITSDPSTGEITPDGTERQFASKTEYYASLFGQDTTLRVYVSTAEGGAVFTYKGPDHEHGYYSPIEQYDDGEIGLISMRRMYSNYSIINHEVFVEHADGMGSSEGFLVPAGYYVIHYQSDMYSAALPEGAWYWCIETGIIGQYTTSADPSTGEEYDGPYMNWDVGTLLIYDESGNLISSESSGALTELPADAFKIRFDAETTMPSCITFNKEMHQIHNIDEFCAYNANLTNVSVEHLSSSQRVFNDLRSAVSAFMNCTSLMSFMFPSAKYGACDVTACFEGCTNLMNVRMDLDDDYMTYERGSFSCASRMFNGCTSLSYVKGLDFNIYGNVSQMFKNCGMLANIWMNQLSMADDISEMFSGCSVIDTIGIPSISPLSIQNSTDAFNGCSNLQRVFLWNVGIYGDVDNQQQALINIMPDPTIWSMVDSREYIYNTTLYDPANETPPEESNTSTFVNVTEPTDLMVPLSTTTCAIFYAVFTNFDNEYFIGSLYNGDDQDFRLFAHDDTLYFDWMDQRLTCSLRENGIMGGVVYRIELGNFYVKINNTIVMQGDPLTTVNADNLYIGYSPGLFERIIIKDAATGNKIKDYYLGIDEATMQPAFINALTDETFMIATSIEEVVWPTDSESYMLLSSD